MSGTFERNTFRHEVSLRILKLINLLLMVSVFTVAWYFYYRDFTAVEYYWKGNVAIILFFIILYYYFGKTYDAFLISYFQMFNIVTSQALSLFLSDTLFYIVMLLLSKGLVNPLPLMLAFADQVSLSIIWTVIVQKIYFKWFPAKQSIIVYDRGRGLEDLIEEYGLSKKFDVKKTVSVEECLSDLSIIDEIEVVFLSGIHSHERNILLKYCLYNDKPIYMIPRIGDVIMSSSEQIHMFHLPMMRVQRYRPNPMYLVAKRLLDIVISLVALIVLSPVFLITAIAIKAGDKGPVIYKQLRLTKNGKKFYIHKFRSMLVDAEKDGIARMSTGVNDDRITSVGRVIRKCRIDELPQFIDILSGNLSIVGPRPERPEIAEEYSKEMPEFQLRLQAKAGLTGYAQVYGKYNSTPYDKLQMDLMYIANPSFIEDLRICIATIKILLAPESTEGIEKGKTNALEDSANTDTHGDEPHDN